MLKKIIISGSAFGCTVHNGKYVYIINYDKSHIYKLDYKLNKMKTYGTIIEEDLWDEHNDRMDELNSPSAVCCQDEFVFVSDHERIQIFTLDLKFYDFIEFNFEPSSIAASSTTIGICGENQGIYFWDIRTKKIKKKYSNINGVLMRFIASHFCIFSWESENGKIYFFDKEGELIDEICVQSLINKIQNIRGFDGFMLSTEDSSLFFLYSDREIFKFKF